MEKNWLDKILPAIIGFLIVSVLCGGMRLWMDNAAVAATNRQQWIEITEVQMDIKEIKTTLNEIQLDIREIKTAMKAHVKDNFTMIEPLFNSNNKENN